MITTEISQYSTRKSSKLSSSSTKTNVDTDFIDIQCAKDNELYAAREDPAPPCSTVKPIVVHEILHEQMNNQFCAEIRGNTNEGGVGI